jgi:hypothetical protein
LEEGQPGREEDEEQYFVRQALPAIQKFDLELLENSVT